MVRIGSKDICERWFHLSTSNLATPCLPRRFFVFMPTCFLFSMFYFRMIIINENIVHKSTVPNIINFTVFPPFHLWVMTHEHMYFDILLKKSLGTCILFIFLKPTIQWDYNMQVAYITYKKTLKLRVWWKGKDFFTLN